MTLTLFLPEFAEIVVTGSHYYYDRQASTTCSMPCRALCVQALLILMTVNYVAVAPPSTEVKEQTAQCLYPLYKSKMLCGVLYKYSRQKLN